MSITAVKLDEAAVADLRATFRGPVVLPGDATYEQDRRIWNGSIDKRPALIARCLGVADVIAAVGFAHEHGLVVAIRGGGHSFPGHSTCDGGLLIDMSLMKGIRVDPSTRRARVQPGVLIGELDHETQTFGLGVPAGIVTHTGVAGLTLGGGIGFQHRKYGLTIDNLLSVDLVTAGGELVKANADENADLFWGVRGGGGNFGIVTEFEFNLNPLGPIVMSGPVLWSIADTPEVLRFYRDWIADCPDELMTVVTARRAPDLPFVPRDLVGQLIVGVVSCYVGPVEDGEKVLAPLRSFGSPVLDGCVPKPFVAHQASFDPTFEPGWWYYFRACDVMELNDEVIDITTEYVSRIQSPITSIALWQLGGVMSRVPDDATAFNGRSHGHTFNINGNVYDGEGFDAERQWVRDFWAALEPHHAGVYVNFLADEGQKRVEEAYGQAKYDRLKALKKKYDPDNFFRLNQNISPD